MPFIKATGQTLSALPPCSSHGACLLHYLIYTKIYTFPLTMTGPEGPEEDAIIVIIPCIAMLRRVATPEREECRILYGISLITIKNLGSISCH